MNNKLLGIVLHEKKTVYWPVPKVACSTLRTHFAKELGLKYDTLNGDGGPKFERTHSVLHSYFNFAYVRNPFERFLSLYNQKICITVDRKVFPDEKKWIDGMSFEDFVKEMWYSVPQERHCMPQNLLIPPGVHTYKMERDIFLKLLTPVNTSIRVDHYTQATKDLVYKMYEHDFIRYGYHYTGYLRD